MSNTIDSKVVQMEFDNSRFEKNVSTSMKTIAGLNQSINNLGNSNGALTSMQNSLSAISNRFSTMGIVGMRVIENLTDKVMGLVGRVTNFVTGSIIQGGLRRAMNLENASFQLNGLLKDSVKVDAIMQNVKDAVDGTAYGLDAAAAVASQVAATGLEGGDMMFRTLRGVAGLAAMTNSSYEEMGQIMTTISGQGRVMGMQLTQLASRGLNAAATLANYLGTTEANVREMVSKGKIDFQTFALAMDDAFGEHAKKANETLNGAFSNVKSALGRIGALFVSPMIQQNGPLVKFLNAVRVKINDIKSAIEPIAALATGTINGLIGAIASKLENLKIDKRGFEAITKFFQYISDRADRLVNPLKDVDKLTINMKEILRDHQAMISGAKKSIDAISTLDVNIKELKRDYQKLNEDGPEKSAVQYSSFAQVLINLSQVLTNFASGVKDRISVIRTAFNDVFGISTIDALRSLVDLLAKVTESMAELSKKFSLSYAESDKLRRAFAGIFSVLSLLWDGIKSIGRGLVSVMPSLSGIRGSILDIAAVIGDKLVGLTEKLRLNGIGDSLEGIGAKLGKLTSGVIDFISSLNLVDKIRSIISWVMEAVPKAAASIGRFIGDVFSGLGSGLASIFQNGDSAFAISTTLLSVLAYNIKKALIQVNKLKEGINPFDKIDKTLSQLKDTLFAWEKDLSASYFIKLGTALLMLAGAVFILSSIDTAKLAAATVAVTVLLGELIGSMHLMEGLKFDKSFDKGTKSLIKLAGALLLMSVAVKILATLSVEELIKGLVSVTVLMGVMVGSIIALSETNAKMDKSVKAITKIATALLILSAALKIIATMSWQDLAKGGAVLVAFLGAMVGYSAAMSQISPASTGGLVTLAIALTILGAALKIFASMSWEGLAKGGAVLIVFLGGLLAYSAAMSQISPASMGNAVALAASLLILSAAFKVFASMSWEGLAKGGAVLAGFAVVLAVLGEVMSAIPPKLPIVMIALAGAILVLAAAFAVFALISWENLIKGFVAIGGALLIFAAASAGLSALIPVIAVFAASMLMFGVGLLAVGAGMLLFASGVSMLGAALNDAGGPIIEFVQQVVELIPFIVEQVGKGIVRVIGVLDKNLPRIIALVVKVIYGICTAIQSSAGKIVQTALDIIVMFLQKTSDYLPIVLDLGFSIIGGFLDGLAAGIPNVVVKAVNVMTAFLDSIGNELPRVIDAGFILIINLLNGIAKAIDDNSEAVGAAMGNLGFQMIKGLADALWAGITTVVDAAVGVAKQAWEAAKNFLGIHSPSRKFMFLGEYSDKGLAKGLTDYRSVVSAAAEDVGESATESLSKSMAGVSDAFDSSLNGNPTITPVIDLSNVTAGAQSIKDTLKDLDNVSTRVGSKYNISSDIKAPGTYAHGSIPATNTTNVYVDGVKIGSSDSDFASAWQAAGEAIMATSRT